MVCLALPTVAALMSVGARNVARGTRVVCRGTCTRHHPKLDRWAGDTEKTMARLCQLLGELGQAVTRRNPVQQLKL